MGHSWCDLPMIFTRDFVTRENYWQIASLATQISLFTVTHALFFISPLLAHWRYCSLALSHRLFCIISLHWDGIGNWISSWKLIIRLLCLVNSLANFKWNFRHVIFKQILVTGGWGISCEIALIWMSLDFTDDQSTLVQVMAWCRQAASHYLNQCWHMTDDTRDHDIGSKRIELVFLECCGLTITR